MWSGTQSFAFLWRTGRAQPVADQCLCSLLFSVHCWTMFLTPYEVRGTVQVWPISVGLNDVCCPRLAPKPWDKILQILFSISLITGCRKILWKTPGPQKMVKLHVSSIGPWQTIKSRVYHFLVRRDVNEK